MAKATAKKKPTIPQLMKRIADLQKAIHDLETGGAVLHGMIKRIKKQYRPAGSVKESDVQWSTAEIVARMRAGRAFPGSPMPWQGFQKLHEDDLRAMYRYLKTVPPTVNEVGPPFEDKP